MTRPCPSVATMKILFPLHDVYFIKVTTIFNIIHCCSPKSEKYDYRHILINEDKDSAKQYPYK